jgi:hypothetical protein
MMSLPLLGPTVAFSQAVSTPTAAAPLPVYPPMVELVKALAWPFFAAIIVILLREPIHGFVTALGTRITKLSIFKVELELVPAAAGAEGPLLDDLRTATTSADISDSFRTLLEQVQSQTPADFAEVNLGTGKDWLSSRLYIAALMLERMRAIQVIVFVERTAKSNRHIVAVVPVQELRWALARRYPWLEAAFLRAYIALFRTQPNFGEKPAPTMPVGAAWLPDPKSLSAISPVIVSSSGGVDPFTARSLAKNFIDSLQEQIEWSGTIPSAPASPFGAVGQAVSPQPSSSDRRTWTDLSASRRERATWVTRELLEELVSPDGFTLWTDLARDVPRAQRTRAVLRRAAPFVALVDKNGEFRRLVNRRALLEEVAASLGEEPART